MNQKRRNPFWYVAGPIIIDFLISLAVQVAAQFIYVFLNIYRAGGIMENSEALLEWAYVMTAEIMQYSTEITAAASLVMMPVALWMFNKDRKQEQMIGAKPAEQVPLFKYAIIAVMGIVVCIGANNLITLSNVSSLSATYESVAEKFYSSGFAMQIICLGIIVPIAEELIFRGLVFKRLRTMMDVKRAIIVSSVIFGAMHGNLVQFIYGLFIGLLLAYMYECFGSVKAPIFAHMVMNLTSVIATKADTFTWIFYSPLRMGIVTVICAAVGAAMFVFMQRMRINDEIETGGTN